MREIRTKNGKVRRYRSAEERAAMVREFEGSGLSKTEFARLHGVNLNVLTGWLRRSRGGEKGEPVFQEVSAAAAPFLGSAWAAEVALPSGVALRVSAGADAALLERLWKLIAR